MGHVSRMIGHGRRSAGEDRNISVPPRGDAGYRVTQAAAYDRPFSPVA